MSILDDLEKRKKQLEPTPSKNGINAGRTEADEFDPLYLEIGRRVRYHRMKRQFSQTALAEAANIGRSTLSNLERQGQRIAIHSLYILAYLLDVSIYDLLPEQLTDDDYTF